jgi:glucosylceramidase
MAYAADVPHKSPVGTLKGALLALLAAMAVLGAAASAPGASGHAIPPAPDAQSEHSLRNASTRRDAARHPVGKPRCQTMAKAGRGVQGKRRCSNQTKGQSPGGRRAKPSPPTSPVSVTQTSADLTQALSPQPGLRFSLSGAQPNVPVVHVKDTVQYQRFAGVGGGMTDSSAWLMWDELPAGTRLALMNALFGRSGIHLSFLRLPIGASDFTVTGVPYTYDDQPVGQSDATLSGFSVDHDEAYILPVLREAQALNPDLYLEAVSWSPPAWMKSTDLLSNVGNAGTLVPSAYGPLARYFVKFLDAYAAQGVRVSAITPQNEPNVATPYPGLELSAQQEAGFVTGYLRPALQAAGLDPSLFGWDLSWGRLTAGNPLVAATVPPANPIAAAAASHPAHGETTITKHKTAKPPGGEARAGSRATPKMTAALHRLTALPGAALSGLAWHCYFGNPTVMSGVHTASPNMQQIVDECTTGGGDIWPTSELLIASFRNYANAVGLWNLALDPEGGPVQAPNSGCLSCTGVVTVNEQTGTYTLSKDFYELGQLSRFVWPGALRIKSDNFVSYKLTPKYQTMATPGLDDVAFENRDGSKVLFAYNSSTVPITFDIEWRGSYVSYSIPSGATTTFDWR